jgi:transcriptional regulator with XRE-family HTH domain
MEAATEARKIADLNQRDFAALLHQDNGFVWKAETGDRRMKVVEIIEISWAAGVRPESFIERIVSKRPLVRFKEERIRIPLTDRMRAYIEETLIEETVTARTATGKSQRQVGEEIGRSESYIWKLENGKLRLEVIEYLALSKAENFRPAPLVAKVAAAGIAKFGRSP